MQFGTKLIHNGNEIDKHTGALSIPIYQASTYHQPDVELRQDFEYSRSANPTRQALENTIAVLEGGKRGFAFASGMAATSSVLATFTAGDHIVICEDVYGGTYRIVNTLFKAFHLESSFVDAADLPGINRAIRKNTRALFLETPSNPLLKITDLQAAIAIAREHRLLVIVDNTFMTPYLQRPLELGADIVIHSATKFIGGHSDVVGGLVAVNNEELGNRIYAVQNGFGAILGPQDCWLLLRGLKTLKLRMDFQGQNALRLAEWLARQKPVQQVYYPGLKEHPGREVHFAQADGAGAVLSFKLRQRDNALRFMKNIRLAAVAVSLGGVETIVSYPATMSHAAMPEQERLRLGITDNLLRISVGLEECEDLISDFGLALELD
ncbi:MAG: aminotransferase class I/II-fold pyridoxal phosphate-dependent enzyme [Syntrophomonadaceae bacterium]|nr:aminotransferase class I/II-fold pyridoxal phosphate-dependent enzyme [Syntrophomonadaceae bacterium]MDD3270985.1 aminotransferase class I/II-fold pyridoxal phosphate-dependent enzyme [Syntrophomonadaceae bacterium]MDD3897394.1 aminotransferase class I/II-fold pyridoxal phosphate-dependent enzyme [Syntrophomonadaceae bacterium]MDD4561669.1 aminotransferase class I/II-fold pyridoxal phosphate-dependent enzyme [Syntrophomonadaceae bacterium]